MPIAWATGVMAWLRERRWGVSTLSAGTLVADQSDAGTAGPGAASADISSVRWSIGGGSGLSPESLVF